VPKRKLLKSMTKTTTLGRKRIHTYEHKTARMAELNARNAVRRKVKNMLVRFGATEVLEALVAVEDCLANDLRA
jgi:hypothetical protein